MRQEGDRAIFTPSELNAQTKELLEQLSFWVQGEVAEFSYKPSYYYAYLVLKDEKAQVKCVVHPSVIKGLDLVPGAQLLVQGTPSVYEARGEYQFKIHSIEMAGQGSILAQLEALKQKLFEEGIFSKAKRPLPRFPERIGVLTGEESAAWTDVQRVIGERYPVSHIVLAHSLVEGDKAPASILKALTALYEKGRCDVILVTKEEGRTSHSWRLTMSVSFV